MVSFAQIMFIGLGYAVSSSSLVIVNKYSLLKWPYPSSLTFLQLTISWVIAFMAGKAGITEVDAFDWKKVKAFSPACLIFFVAIACNMKLLQYANVDTFIVLRSTVPLATTFAETFTLGTPMPGRNALLSLILIVVGAIGYVYTDKEFNLTAYSWGFAYVVAMVVDTVLVKKVVTDVQLTAWGLVYYNNLIASALYPVFVFVTGEFKDVMSALVLLGGEDTSAAFAVGISCVFGVAISYFGLNARKMLTATAFSVLGVVCKFGTVLINTLLWEYHATPVGIFWLCVCIAAGIMYQQAMKSAALTPSNAPPKSTEMKGGFSKVPTEDDDEGEKV